MKLNALHEATLTGAIAFKPATAIYHSHDIHRPRGQIRWYLAYSKDTPIDGLHEGDGNQSGKKVKTQFGSQTSRPKTKVWQPEEGHEELTNPSLYVPPGTKKAKPYKWPETTFHGQSEGHGEHILK